MTHADLVLPSVASLSRRLMDTAVNNKSRSPLSVSDTSSFADSFAAIPSIVVIDVKDSHTNVSARLTMSNVETLERLFVLRSRVDVLSYLAENPILVRLLIDASEQIDRYFLTTSRYLRVTSDPEDSGVSQLILSIQTTLDPSQALPRLWEFDEQWWLTSASRGGGKLIINLDYK